MPSGPIIPTFLLLSSSIGDLSLGLAGGLLFRHGDGSDNVARQ